MIKFHCATQSAKSEHCQAGVLGVGLDYAEEGFRMYELSHNKLSNRKPRLVSS